MSPALHTVFGFLRLLLLCALSWLLDLLRGLNVNESLKQNHHAINISSPTASSSSSTSNSPLAFVFLTVGTILLTPLSLLLTGAVAASDSTISSWRQRLLLLLWSGLCPLIVATCTAVESAISQAVRRQTALKICASLLTLTARNLHLLLCHIALRRHRTLAPLLLGLMAAAKNGSLSTIAVLRGPLAATLDPWTSTALAGGICVLGALVSLVEWCCDDASTSGREEAAPRRGCLANVARLLHLPRRFWLLTAVAGASGACASRYVLWDSSLELLPFNAAPFPLGGVMAAAALAVPLLTAVGLLPFFYLHGLILCLGATGFLFSYILLAFTALPHTLAEVLQLTALPSVRLSSLATLQPLLTIARRHRRHLAIAVGALIVAETLAAQLAELTGAWLDSLSWPYADVSSASALYVVFSFLLLALALLLNFADCWSMQNVLWGKRPQRCCASDGDRDLREMLLTD